MTPGINLMRYCDTLHSHLFAMQVFYARDLWRHVTMLFIHAYRRKRNHDWNEQPIKTSNTATKFIDMALIYSPDHWSQRSRGQAFVGDIQVACIFSRIIFLFICLLYFEKTPFGVQLLVALEIICLLRFQSLHDERVKMSNSTWFLSCWLEGRCDDAAISLLKLAPGMWQQLYFGYM